MKKTRAITSYWKRQLPVDYLDDSIVQNAWETIAADLSGGMPARIFFVIIEQTNNGATAETLELEITINGTAYTLTVAADSGVVYYGYCQISLTGGDFTFNFFAAQQYTLGSPGYSTNRNIPFNAESVGLIRVRQTTDVDVTSAQIEVNIVWDKLTRIS